MEQNEYSVILSNGLHTWYDCESDKPNINEPVLVRVISRIYPPMETERGNVYPETQKLATWDGEKWTICRPFPKYDFDILTFKESLRDGTEITHWTEATEEAKEAWVKRMNPKCYVNHLEFRVDEETEPLVMNALYIAETAVAKELERFMTENDPDSIDAQNAVGELRHALYTLQDLRSAVDFGGVIENPLPKDEDEEKLSDNEE